MPTYVNWFEVDWRWPTLREDERAVVRRYHANLSSDPENVSWSFLAEFLSKASNELPGRVICARGAEPDDDEDLENEFVLVFEDGNHRVGEPDEFDPDGAVPDAPTSQDYQAAGIAKVCQPLYFDGSMLDEITDEATRQDKSLSWIVQKAWTLARQEIRTLPAYKDASTDSAG